MHLPEHEFLKPATLTEALAALGQAGERAKLIAGGTDVVYNMRGRLFAPEVLISVRRLPDLQQVELRPDGTLVLGAGCRLTDLERHAATQRYPALVRALRSVASRHVRNMATLGGNLCLETRCWYTNQTAEWRQAKGPCLKTGVDDCHALRGAMTCVALNASDVAPMLIAMDAVAVLRSATGEREVPLRAFYRDDGIRHTVRRPDELLTAVHVPATDDRLVYIKETARKGNDFAYGSIAGRATGAGERPAQVTLVLGSLTTMPRVLREPAELAVRAGLGRRGIEEAVAATRSALGPLTNLYTPAAYKATLARTLVREALLALREA